MDNEYQVKAEAAKIHEDARTLCGWQKSRWSGGGDMGNASLRAAGQHLPWNRLLGDEAKTMTSADAAASEFPYPLSKKMNRQFLILVLLGVVWNASTP